MVSLPSVSTVTWRASVSASLRCPQHPSIPPPRKALLHCARPPRRLLVSFYHHLRAARLVRSDPCSQRTVRCWSAQYNQPLLASLRNRSSAPKTRLEIFCNSSYLTLPTSTSQTRVDGRSLSAESPLALVLYLVASCSRRSTFPRLRLRRVVGP